MDSVQAQIFTAVLSVRTKTSNPDAPVVDALSVGAYHLWVTASDILHARYLHYYSLQ